jgi:hypothetical protein
MAMVGFALKSSHPFSGVQGDRPLIRATERAAGLSKMRAMCLLPGRDTPIEF